MIRNFKHRNNLFNVWIIKYFKNIFIFVIRPEEPKTTSWSIPSLKPTTPAPTPDNADPYANEDFSKYTSKVYDSPGIADRLNDAGFSVHPRVKNCFSAIKTGAQLGGAVGGIFGALSGTVEEEIDEQLFW